MRDVPTTCVTGGGTIRALLKYTSVWFIVLLCNVGTQRQTVVLMVTVEESRRFCNTNRYVGSDRLFWLPCDVGQYCNNENSMFIVRRISYIHVQHQADSSRHFIRTIKCTKCGWIAIIHGLCTSKFAKRGLKLFLLNQNQERGEWSHVDWKPCQRWWKYCRVL